ncbi:MAG: TonB-dependent receptor [Acidobacteria bacterium]|nr:TonB-dependent receptor [Acidobacteriota bacterium]
MRPYPPLPPTLLLLTTLTAGAAAAQDPDDPGSTVTDEITVTAQRVEEAVQDVPISIITRSGEELEQQAIGDVQALAEASPGVVISGQSPTTGEVAIYIRGIGSSTLGIGTEPTVGYYVDGVYMPRPQAAVNPFLDLERIEILRGPQGTLWGRNSTAGAVNVITRAPEGQFHGRLFTSFSEYDSSESAAGRRSGLSLTGPVSGKVWGRFTGVAAQVEDPTYNDFLDTGADNFDGVTLRGSLTFLPSDSLTFTVRADSTDDDAHANFPFKPFEVSPYSTVGTLNRFYGYSEPADVHRISTETPALSLYEESGFSLTVDKAMAGGTSLTSISSWREFDSRRDADIDGSPHVFVTNAATLNSQWWSQEFQLHGASERANWVAGAYAFNEESGTQVANITDTALLGVWLFANSPQLFLFDPTNYCSLGILAPPFLCGPAYYNAVAPFLGLPLPGAPTPLPFESNLDASLYAAYGQVDWQLGDRVTLTTGARYTADEKTHDQAALNFQTFMPELQVLNDSWSALTPKLGLEIRPRENVMLYGAVTAGYKSGGYNSVSLQPAFDEETVTSFEIGIKSSVADRKVRINAAAFHYDYDDLQVAVLYPDRSVVENAAKARIRGLDFELSARPNPRFSFDLSFELLDDEFTRFTTLDPFLQAQFVEQLLAAGLIDPAQVLLGGGGALPIEPSDLSGNGLPRAPDFSATASLRYTFDLGGSGSLTARGEYQHTDDVAFDAFERFVQPSYGLFHAQLRWTSPQGRVFLAAYGRNLGDEEYRLSQFFVNYTGSLAVWAPPAEVGLQLGFDF